MGEVRRQIARGMTLLNKEAWTPQLDYRNSLVLRSERIVIDSTAPYAMRIEQIYRPSIELGANLTTKVRIRKRVPPARPGAAAVPAPEPRELGTFDGVSRDLRETPFAIELDLAAVEDGAQVIEAEMFDGTTSLGTANLGVFVHKGLDAKLKTLEAAAATAAPAVRADVLFPGDYIKNVNRGRIELADFNVGAEIARAEAILAESKGGKDPFTGQDRRLRAALRARRRERDHAVSRLRAEGLRGVEGDAARDCAARPRRAMRIRSSIPIRSCRRNCPRSTAS